jgi:hypothetical protein
VTIRGSDRPDDVETTGVLGRQGVDRDEGQRIRGNRPQDVPEVVHEAVRRDLRHDIGLQATEEAVPGKLPRQEHQSHEQPDHDVRDRVGAEQRRVAAHEGHQGHEEQDRGDVARERPPEHVLGTAGGQHRRVLEGKHVVERGIDEEQRRQREVVPDGLEAG